MSDLEIKKFRKIIEKELIKQEQFLEESLLSAEIANLHTQIKSFSRNLDTFLHSDQGDALYKDHRDVYYDLRKLTDQSSLLASEISLRLPKVKAVS